MRSVVSSIVSLCAPLSLVPWCCCLTVCLNVWACTRGRGNCSGRCLSSGQRLLLRWWRCSCPTLRPGRRLC
uniref:Putative secreted protein n=1 Tax=Anopheles darlingi TaxID=43151 RepID=A0A2M4D593_ANODA